MEVVISFLLKPLIMLDHLCMVECRILGGVSAGGGVFSRLLLGVLGILGGLGFRGIWGLGFCLLVIRMIAVGRNPGLVMIVFRIGILFFVDNLTAIKSFHKFPTN